MPVIQDPTTGGHMMCTEHRTLITLLDDTAFFTLALALANMDIMGMGAPVRLFIPEDMRMRDYSYMNQVIRHALLFGTFAEVRRMIEMTGLNTEASHYLDHMKNLLSSN